MKKLIALIKDYFYAVGAVTNQRPIGQAPQPNPPPENTREAFRRGTTPWNYSRPRPNQELLGQLDYLVQIHGPAEVEKRLRELAERQAKRDSERLT